MPEETYRNLIRQLADLDFTGRIALVTNNEPLLDPRIVRFISEARQACPMAFLDLLTNGRLLTGELLHELLAAGLDRLTINDYRADRKQHPLKMSKGIEEIRAQTDGMFYRKIYINPRSTRGSLSNRAGNTEGKRIKLPLKQFCVLPFTGMWINPGGKAILCCQDYSYEEIMGDANQETLREIWFGQKYQSLRERLLQNDRTGFICEKCDYSGLPLAGPKKRNLVAKAMRYLVG